MQRNVRCVHSLRVSRRRYATVGPMTYLGKPPKQPIPPPPPPSSSQALDSVRWVPDTSPLHNRILSNLRPESTSLHNLIDQYVEHSGNVLDTALPYESRPNSQRRTKFDLLDDANVVMIAHAVQHKTLHKVAFCSGFAIDVSQSSQPSNENLIVTCAHTMEDIRHSYELASLPKDPSQILQTSRSGSLIVSGSTKSLIYHPVTSIPSSLPRADLLLLSTPKSPENPVHIPTLPISPYPAQLGANIRAHFVVYSNKQPEGDGWRPWIAEGAWSKWVKGKVTGYRDFAGREAKPGTYDALTHLLFEPLPTVGSSGGPIVDEESGAVIGTIVGTRMDNRIEGVRGWGVPSETIFEMFSLPGLKLKRN